MLRKMQLKNGINVFFFKSAKAPVVSTRVWVKTGSADEKKGEEGLSHFIEHLVFKGSKNLGVGDAAKMIESSGGQLNAYTSFDETVFHVTQHKDEFEVGLEVLSEMLGYPTFDADEVDKEREVVLEEIKRSNDNPGRQASRLMFSTVYNQHPYGIPVIGYAENISNVSNEVIKDYFNRRYVPENMFVVISGDFEFAYAEEKVKEFFEPIPSNKLNKVERINEPEQKVARIQAKNSKFKQNLINLSWPIPDIKDEDIAALDMLAMVLGQSESSILNQKLRLEKTIVRYSYSSMFATRDMGFFNISLSVDKQNIEKALIELIKTLQYFVDDKWDKELIEISRASLESDEVYPYETVDGISRKIGYYEYNFSDPEFSKEYLDRVSNLKLKDLYRVFKKYLNPNKISITLFCEDNEDNLNAVANKWLQQYKEFYNSLPSFDTIKEDIHKKIKPIKGLSNSSTPIDSEEVLSCGVRLYIRQTKEVPVISVRTAFLGGLRYEPNGIDGVSEMMTNCWGKATETLNEKDLSKFVELRSSGISSFCGKNTNGMSLTTLTPYFEDTFKLYLQSIHHPQFDKKIIEREKIFMNQALQQQQDSPAQLAIKAFMKEMFKNHPYGRSSLGTVESIKGLSKENVVSYYKSIFDSNRVSLCISGDIKDKEKLKDQINESFKNYSGSENRLKQIAFKKLEQDQKKYLQLDKEQTHLIIGYPGLKINDPKRYILDVMQSVLAGQGGRLFLELRDKHSMAYSLSPMRMDGLDGGFFGAYIGCSPEKAKKAIEMLEIEFNKLVDKLVSDEEIERSKKFIIGKYHIELQKNSAFTSSILFNDIYGILSTEVFEYKNKIMKVSKGEIRLLAKELFSQQKVVSAVGRERPW